MGHLIELVQHLLRHYGYPALVVVVLLENAGIPVPGETAVLFAGFLSSEAGERFLDSEPGTRHFNLYIVIALTVVAAVTGDNLGFWMGRRWARPRLQSGRRFLFLTPGMLQVAEGYFHRYGTWTIFFARFITGIRVVGALAAGTAGMPWPRFLVANACGAIAWAVTMSLIGYFFGENLRLLERILGRAGLIALGCFVLVILVALWWRRHRRKPPATPEC
jgi:membrane-associated protein